MRLETMLFCGNRSRYRLPHLEFNDFHISFHNLGQIFRELCSHAREEFRVCMIGILDDSLIFEIFHSVIIKILLNCCEPFVQFLDSIQDVILIFKYFFNFVLPIFEEGKLWAVDSSRSYELNLLFALHDQILRETNIWSGNVLGKYFKLMVNFPFKVQFTSFCKALSQS